MADKSANLEERAIREELQRLNSDYDPDKPIYPLVPGFVEEIHDERTSEVRFDGMPDGEYIFLPTAEINRRNLDQAANKLCMIVGYHTKDGKLAFDWVKLTHTDELAAKTYSDKGEPTK